MKYYLLEEIVIARVLYNVISSAMYRILSNEVPLPTPRWT